MVLREVKRILFVCQGNIIRSPLAEGLFNHYAEVAGATLRYTVDSAGTSGYHVGEPSDARMLRVAARRGFQYSHRSRQFRRQDLDDFDLLLAMDRENYDDLLSLARSPEQEAKIHLLREFDPSGGPRHSVPDPYYGDGGDGFEEVYEVIDRSVKGLLEYLELDGRQAG